MKSLLLLTICIPMLSFGLPTARMVTTNITLAATDTVTFCDATSGVVTVTIPTCATTGFAYNHFVVKKVDSSANACIITGSGSDVIDGVASYSITTRYESKEVVCDGSSTWYIL